MRDNEKRKIERKQLGERKKKREVKKAENVEHNTIIYYCVRV